MRNEKYLECDYYMVEIVDGVKCITICGYFYYAGESCDEDKPDEVYRAVEVSANPMPIAKLKEIYEAGELWDVLAEEKQWIGDLTEEEVDDAMENYYGDVDGNGHGGIELLISNVTEDTPCGDYVDYE